MPLCKVDCVEVEFGHLQHVHAGFELDLDAIDFA